MLAPVLLPGVMVGAAATAQAIALLRTPLEGPEFTVFSALFQVRAWSVGVLAAGLAWTVVRARLTRSAVSRLASDLAGYVSGTILMVDGGYHIVGT